MGLHNGLAMNSDKSVSTVMMQALTTPEIFRLPIVQPAGKNQVAPIKIQVAPIRQAHGWWFYAVWQNEITVDFAAK